MVSAGSGDGDVGSVVLGELGGDVGFDDEVDGGVDVDGAGSVVVGGGVVDGAGESVGVPPGSAVGVVDAVAVVDGVVAVSGVVVGAGLAGAGVEVVSTGGIAAGSFVFGEGANSR